MKKIIVMTIKLLVITVVAGVLLGVVNAITKDPIAAQEAKAADEARFAAFPSATEFEKIDIDISEDYSLIQNVYTAKDASGSDIGVAIGIKTKAYSTGLNMTVGLSAQGTITGVVIGSNQETPGLGSKAAEPKFIDQFKDVSFDTPLVVMKTGASAPYEIQAIASATITSDGVTYAVNKAVEYYTKVLGMGENVTNEAIAEQEEKVRDADMLAAFAGADAFEKIDIEIPDKYAAIKELYRAIDAQGSEIGVLVVMTSKGYSEDLGLMIGLSKDEYVAGLVLNVGAETPGIGTLVEDSSFTDQFVGAPFDPPLTLVRNESTAQTEIQAVSGATISSRGVMDAINTAVGFYTDILSLGDNVTSEAIAELEANAQAENMQAAYPDAAEFEVMDIQIPAEYAQISSIYSALDAQGKQIGILVDVTTKGRAEELDLLVGMSEDGFIVGLVLKTNVDVPWLGTMVEDTRFVDQFIGQPISTPFMTIRSTPTQDNEIQAVSGATISSRGVAYSVNAAAQFYADMLGIEIVVPIATPTPSPVPTPTAIPPERIIDPVDEVRAQVFPEAYSFELIEIELPEHYAFVDSFHRAYDAWGNEIGVIVEITTNGYYYGINYTVGFSNTGVITGMAFGENVDEPGVGDELHVDYFIEEYIGLSFLEELRVSMMQSAPPGEIDAVTGATIMVVDVTYYISEAARFYIDVIGGVS
ncbi:MAG: FMN-binding protein [Clostridia bacterium]|jgi:Na+-translocating ferredoxin:NAD+ oxidoreductase subunit G|nr:FMN-binding protein [Clostridia bacterium]MBT7121381.1 FMN-binding protein [Clostridia bacterium]